MLSRALFEIGLLLIALPALIYALFGLSRWAKRRAKGAYLMLAMFPLLSMFPIPPSQLEVVIEAKQEQPKKKEDDGDPPDDPD